MIYIYHMYNIWKHVAKHMENYGKHMENDETHIYARKYTVAPGHQWNLSNNHERNRHRDQSGKTKQHWTPELLSRWELIITTLVRARLQQCSPLQHRWFQLSLNHHTRLGKDCDFSSGWYGLRCSHTTCNQRLAACGMPPIKQPRVGLI